MFYFFAVAPIEYVPHYFARTLYSTKPNLEVYSYTLPHNPHQNQEAGAKTPSLLLLHFPPLFIDYGRMFQKLN